MLILKLYVLAWLLIAASAAAVYVAGFSGLTIWTIYGFVFSTLVFMGIVAVLPVLVSEHFEPKIREN